MKKLFTLLLLTLAAFTFTSAQTTNCNAKFNFSISGLTVKFTADMSADPDIHHYWKFGDGKISSNISPVHVYTSGGTYTVKHIIYRKNNSGTVACVESIEKRIELNPTTINCDLSAKFSFERDRSQPNKVKFTNLSGPAGNIKEVKWSFGDGTYSSDFNPSHVYAKSGLYKVCLIIKKDNNCVNETCTELQVQIPLPPCRLSANFAWQANNTQSNKIHFLNLSSHFETGDKIRWTFGDGISSSDVNPIHTYTSPGTYNVCIRIEKNNNAGTAPCVKELCKQVIIGNECRLEANFNFEADATNKNKIYFKNTSIPLSSVTHVKWSFGDGNTSASINPDHVYAKAGIYRVCLKISSNNTCYREICKIVEIKDTELNCLDISKFTITRSTANCLEFKFIPAIQNPNWRYVWSFGDGTRSNEMNPSHVYPRSGRYTVFLTVYRSATCISTSHKVAETGACFSCNNIWAKFEYKRESSISNKIYFHAISNYPITSQTWTITKLSISGSPQVTLIQNNPVYEFNEPGDYRVCLKVVTQGGCVKEYCEVIHIGLPNTACILTSYPNPATNQVSIAFKLEHPAMINVYIFNSLNILVKQKNQQGSTGNNVVATNIEGLVPGWYTIKVIYGNRVCYSRFQKT